MKTRLYTPADREALLDMHRRQSIKLTGSAEGMTICDPDDKEQILTVVVEDDAGTPVAFGHARLLVEGSLTLDPGYGSPRDRHEACKKVIANTLARLTYMGVKVLVTKSLAGERFAERLKKFGFKREILPVLSFEMKGIEEGSW